MIATALLWSVQPVMMWIFNTLTPFLKIDCVLSLSLRRKSSNRWFVIEYVRRASVTNPVHPLSSLRWPDILFQLSTLVVSLLSLHIGRVSVVLSLTGLLVCLRRDIQVKYRMLWSREVSFLRLKRSIGMSSIKDRKKLMRPSCRHLKNNLRRKH